MASKSLSNYDKYLRFNRDSNFKLGGNPTVWVKDKDRGFARAEVTEKSGADLKLKMGDGALVTMPEKDTLSANPGKFDGVKDCAELSHLNEASVLHNLRVRYDDDLIHTYSGLFLVVVNPYKWLPIYTEELIQYYSGKRRADVHPHVYAVADEAYRAMLRNKANQSILITGESGAGKTENTKKVIQYLATIAGKATQGGKLEEQILQANPMLEAFGNAKTNKNDNSSRFGKFIRVQFNAGGVICGATIQTYLLEKSRVVQQGPGERTFHIFYQLPQGATGEQKSRYKLTGPADQWGFYSDKNATALKSMDDVKEFEHTLHAMKVVGLSDEEQDAVFRVMAGIMHCGNIKYGSSYGSEGANIETGEVVDTVAELWKVDRVKFEKALIRPKILAGRELVEKHLNQDQASYARNAMCKAIYERAFLWIVKKLNSVLAADREANFIGVLDIAGFEIFQNNSFEQLCINFTNEKLQEFFNNHMFKLEQEEYAKEQITWVYMDFGLDSKQTIDLIEKKPNSIMSFLDEESIFPKATDETLIQKLHTLATKNTKYSKVQFKKLNFQIQHYAGDVVYDVTDWITKNKDPLQDDIATSLQNSADEFVGNLFTDPDLDPRERIAMLKAAKAAGGGQAGRSRGGGGQSTGAPAAGASASSASASKGGASFMTVATTYKEQLDDLMTTLRSTEPNFIRCIIPNLKKAQKDINAELVLEQLACNGVLEGIRISRKGFPNRITYPEFVKRYYLLHPTIRRNEAETKDATITVMKHNADAIEAYFPSVSKDGEEARERPLYQFGTTKIFFRHGVLAWLEEQREKKLGQMVISIQAGARGWIARSAYRKIGLQSAAARTLQKNLKCWVLFKDWTWWKLFQNSKPLLVRVDYDAMIKDLEAKVHVLEVELEKVNKERESLRANLQETNAGIASLESELDAANKRLNALTADHTKLSDDKETLNSQIEGLEGKLQILQKEKSALEHDFAETDQQLKETTVRLSDVSSRRKGLEDDKKSNEQKIAQSNAAIEGHEADQAKLQKQLAALEDELNATSSDRDASSDKASQLAKQVAQLQAELEDLRDELDVGKKDRSKLEQQRKDLDSSLKALQGDIANETSALNAAKAQQASLQSDVDKLNANVDDATRKVGDLSKTVKKLEGDLQEATADLEDAKQTRASADKKSKTLQAQKDELDERTRALEGENSRLDGAKRETSATLDDLTRDIDSLSGTVSKLQKSIQGSEADLARVQGDLERAEANRDNLGRTKKKLEQDLKDAEAELDAESAKASTLSKVKSKLDGDIKSAEDSLAALESKKGALTSENKKLKADLADAEGQLEDAESKRGDLERQLKNLQKELDDSKAQLDEEADERARAEKAKKAAEASLSELRADVADLESSNKALEDSIKRKTAEAAELAGKGDAAALNEAKQKWTNATKALVLELKDARDKLAEAEEQNRAYEREVRNVEDTLMSEKERADVLGANAGKNSKEADQKLRGLKDEADATRAKAAQIKAELAASQKELENLRSILATEVKRRR